MRSLAKNFAWNLAYQALIALLPLMTAPYLARVLDADRIGAYSFAHSIVSYFALFAVAGTTLHGQRSIAKANVKGESLKQVFVELLILRVIGVVAALSVYFGFIYNAVDDKMLYLVAAIDILSVVFDISWFYQGLEQFGRITICNSIGKLLAVIGIFTLVKSRADLNLYVLICCGTGLLGNAMQWCFLPSALGGGKITRLHAARHVRPVFTLFISQIAIQAYTVLDKTMIGLISGSDFENGYYDQAQRLVKALTAVVTSIGTVMASRIAVVWHSNDLEREKEVEDLLLFSFRLIFALGLPVTVGLNIIAPRFVPFFFGEGYEPVILLVQVLAWIVPIIGCSNIIGMQWFVPSGREHLVTRSVVTGAIVNVVINSFLIEPLGALGAVIASVIAEMVVAGTQVLLAYRELPIRRILQLLIRYGSFSAVVGVVGSFLAANLPLGFGGMMIIVLICVGVYLGLLLLTKDPLLKEMRSK